MTPAARIIADANGELCRLPEDHPVVIPVQDFAWADEEPDPMRGLVGLLYGLVAAFTGLCIAAFVVVQVMKWAGVWP